MRYWVILPRGTGLPSRASVRLTLPGVTPACEAAARRASRLEAFSEALPN